MKLVTEQMEQFLAGGAWIRRIFEHGLELKKQYGEEAVCDFSLGNPDLPPPSVVGECLADLAGQADKPFAFGYMPNPGYPAVRAALAGHLATEQNCAVAADDLLLLDATVAIARLGVSRNDDGAPRLRRVYGFEYSDTGNDRHPGSIVMLGSRVLVINLNFRRPPSLTLLN